MPDYSHLDEDLNKFFVNLYNIGFVILTPIICVLGLTLNIICCITFFKLKEKIFFYLAYKSLAESLYLATGAISPFISCYSCDLEDTYFRMMITLITAKFFKMAVFSFVTILEIEISFNRYSLVNSHSTNTVIEKKDKIKILIYTIVSILLYLPCFFAFEIKRIIPYENEYRLVQNNIGNHPIFMYVYSYLGFIGNILSILVLLPLNVIILIKFKKFIKNKSQNRVRPIAQTLVQARQENVANRLVLQENAKTETRFTRMIVAISFLFIFSRLCEASIAFFILYNQYIKLIDYFKLYFSILNIFVYALNYIIFSCNFFIYYIFNSTFKKKFKFIFCCKK